MYWTVDMSRYLETINWDSKPTRDDIIDHLLKIGAPDALIENIKELPDNEEVYDSIDQVWPDRVEMGEFSELSDEDYFGDN